MKLPTPLEPAPAGLAPCDAVYLKREDVHELGAFKWRGALPTLEQYRRDGASLVVTASTGNHGSATAWAAQRLGLRAVVYAPEDVSRTKLDLMRELGAEVRLGGADVDDSKDAVVRGRTSIVRPSSKTVPNPHNWRGMQRSAGR